MIRCEFCSTTFTTKRSLKHHQNNTKYCLVLQASFCEYCKKQVPKQQLTEHHQKCIDRIPFLLKEIDDKNAIIDEKNAIIEDFKNRLERIASKPKTTNNNNNNNVSIDLSMLVLHRNEIMKTINDRFTYEYFIDGQKGVANFAVDHILTSPEGKLLYRCTDPSRRIFIYKDENGNIHKDINSRNLASCLYEGVYPKSQNIYNNRCKDASQEHIKVYSESLTDIYRLKDDPKKFSQHLTVQTTSDNMLTFHSDKDTDDDDDYEEEEEISKERLKELEDEVNRKIAFFQAQNTENEYIIMSDNEST